MLYPGNIMWHEQGYRFSWRVMLMEKIGYTTFKIEQENGKYFYVNNEEHLPSYQQKQMSLQPDIILKNYRCFVLFLCVIILMHKIYIQAL